MMKSFGLSTCWNPSGFDQAQAIQLQRCGGKWWEGGKSGLPNSFFVARFFFAVGWGCLHHVFFRNCLWEKRSDFLLLKKNLVQDVWRKSSAKLRCRWRQAVVGSTSASMALESRGHFLCCLVVAEGGWNVAHNKKNLEAGDEVMCVCSWAPPSFFENAFFRVCMETVFQKKW